MSAAPTPADLHDQALTELLALGMAAAREVQARLLAADDVAQAAELSLAFNRLSRSVRQTIALQAKLAGARRREGREDAAEAQRADEDRGQRRKAQVRHAVERLIWTETESDAEAERLVDELDEMVSEEMLYDGFGDEAVEAHIARLSAELGVTPPATACPTDAGEGTAPAPEAPGLGWRSSA